MTHYMETPSTRGVHNRYMTTTAALAAIVALGRALQDPHLDAANRAAIHAQIDTLRAQAVAK